MKSIEYKLTWAVLRGSNVDVSEPEGDGWELVNTVISHQYNNSENRIFWTWRRPYIAKILDD